MPDASYDNILIDFDMDVRGYIDATVYIEDSATSISVEFFKSLD